MLCFVVCSFVCVGIVIGGVFGNYFFVWWRYVGSGFGVFGSCVFVCCGYCYFFIIMFYVVVIDWGVFLCCFCWICLLLGLVVFGCL